MKVRLVFCNQWHQPIPCRKPETMEIDLRSGAMVPVPVGSIFVKLEPVAEGENE